MDAVGNYVVVWEADDEYDTDVNPDEMFARRFSLAGNSAYGEMQLSDSNRRRTRSRIIPQSP